MISRFKYKLLLSQLAFKQIKKESNSVVVGEGFDKAEGSGRERERRMSSDLKEMNFGS